MIRSITLFALGLVCASFAGVLGAQPARAFDWPQSEVASVDPAEPYWCGDSVGSKLEWVVGAGRSLDHLLAITVLECKTFSGGGDAKCPAGSPYDYCLQSSNDGLGNAVKLGVLEVSAKTDPNGLYTGCSAETQPQPKLQLIAGLRDPRYISGIVTLRCGPATGSAGPKIIECPNDVRGNRRLFGYCIDAQNDGHGNAVIVGVIPENGPGDPAALYGECSKYNPAKGFMPKQSLVDNSVGPYTSKIVGIELLECSFYHGAPGLARVDCGQVLPGALASRYDYCVYGTDQQGSLVVAGVTAQH